MLQHYTGGYCSGLGFADRHYVTKFYANSRHGWMHTRSFRLTIADRATSTCRPKSTVRRRPRLPTSASTLASSGPCRTAAAAGRSREESWTDRRRSTMRRLSPISNITAYYPRRCVERPLSPPQGGAHPRRHPRQPPRFAVLDRDVDASGCAWCHQAGLRSARLRGPTPSSRLEYWSSLRSGAHPPWFHQGHVSQRWWLHRVWVVVSEARRSAVEIRGRHLRL